MVNYLHFSEHGNLDRAYDKSSKAEVFGVLEAR